MTVSDNTIVAEVLGDFFKCLGRRGPIVSNEIARMFKESPGIRMELRANFGSVVAFKNPTAALTTLHEVINFHHSDANLEYRKFV